MYGSCFATPSRLKSAQWVSLQSRKLANRGWQAPAIHNRVGRRLKHRYISFIEDHGTDI
jgi:hypothetical protein